MKALKFLFGVVMLIGITVFAPSMNLISFDATSSSHVAAADGITTTNAEECERKDMLGWIFCGASDMVTGLLDMMINEFIVPFLRWRLLL